MLRGRYKTALSCGTGILAERETALPAATRQEANPIEQVFAKMTCYTPGAGLAAPHLGERCGPARWPASRHGASLTALPRGYPRFLASQRRSMARTLGQTDQRSFHAG
jgi:hypothetical protein